MYIHKIYSYSQDYSEIILIQQKLIPAKKKLFSKPTTCSLFEQFDLFAIQTSSFFHFTCIGVCIQIAATHWFECIDVIVTRGTNTVR